MKTLPKVACGMLLFLLDGIRRHEAEHCGRLPVALLLHPRLRPGLIDELMRLPLSQQAVDLISINGVPIVWSTHWVQPAMRCRCFGDSGVMEL